MRYVPELVFINCCHLGNTADDAQRATAFHRLAANLATQFIRMGARAVIAAGWAVDDKAGQAFAQAFYEEMFAPNSFGEAVVRARERIFAAYPGVNTWGAYQCYGDPAFSLMKVTSGSTSQAPASESEIVIFAEQVTRKARTADERERQDLLLQLEAVLGTAPEAWKRSPALCAAMGAAFGELNEFARAIEYYEVILEAEAANAPIRGLEQLANLRVRWARVLGTQDAAARSRALEELAEAETLLGSLLNIGRTAERQALLGSLYKRRAMLTADPERADALRKMRDAYAAAFDRVSEGEPLKGTYQLANRLAAEVVQSWSAASPEEDSEAATKLVDGLKQLEMLANTLSLTSTNFFDLTARGDCLFLEALRTRRLDPQVSAAIEGAYTTAGARGVSPRHWASLCDQVLFFESMVQDMHGSDWSELSAGLERLRKTLGR